MVQFKVIWATAASPGGLFRTAKEVIGLIYCGRNSNLLGCDPAMPPTQTGIASNCDVYHLVVTNETSSGIVDSYGNVTLEKFYR